MFIVRWFIMNKLLKTILITTLGYIGIALPISSSTFTPYVDVTLNAVWDGGRGRMLPSAVPGLVASAGVKAVRLAFLNDVTGASNGGSWGGVAEYTLDYAQTITQTLEAASIKVSISFGGLSGSFPGANDPDSTTIYNRFNAIRTIYPNSDFCFDIESDPIQSNTTQLARIMTAFKTIQDNYGTKLIITIPILPDALLQGGKNAITAANNAGVTFNVNLMTMDYGSFYNSQSMYLNAVQAANTTVTYLKTKSMFSSLSDAAILSRVEVTPMIGVNDTPPLIHTLTDQVNLATWCVANNVNLAYWSLTRDNAGNANNTAMGSGPPGFTASASYSGVAQAPFEFAQITNAMLNPPVWPNIYVVSGTTTTRNDVISGTGPLTKSGSGTLVLTNTNTYTGGTAINGGTLQVGSLSNLGTSSAVTFTGAGTLATTADLTLISAAKTAAATFSPATSTTLTLTSLTGAAGLTMAGAGTLLLTGTVPTTGAISLTGGGILNLSNSTTIPAVTFSSGTPTLTTAGTTTIAAMIKKITGTLNITSGTTTITRLFGTSSLIKTGAGTLVQPATVPVNPGSSSATFTPYVDVILGTVAGWDGANGKMSPINLPSMVTNAGIKAVRLAFLNDDTTPGNGGSWGGSYPLNYAQPTVQNLEAAGIKVSISFGGLASTFPGINDPDISTIYDRFNAIRTMYPNSDFCFDIEVDPIQSNTTQLDLIMTAFQGIQNTYGTRLIVTIPILPDAILQGGKNAITAANNAGVTFNVNLMTMDYGPSYGLPTTAASMYTHAVNAANFTAAYLKTKSLFSSLSDAAILSRVEVTPMIGVNDTKPLTHTLQNQTDLATWCVANTVNLAYWSLTRDNNTGTGHIIGWGAGDTASALFSGVAQNAYQFAEIANGILSPPITTSLTFDVVSSTTTNSSALGGTGPLTKAGAGTLVLSGTNTYTGDTQIAAGILQIASLSNIGSAGTITFTGAGTLATTANITLASAAKTAAATFSPATSTTLTLTALTGAADMTVTGADSTSIVSVASALPSGGVYTVTGGVLRLANIAAAGGGTVTVNSGAILDCATNSVFASDRFPSGTLTLRAGGKIQSAAGTFAKAIVLGA